MFKVKRDYKLVALGPGSIPYTVILGPPNGYYPLVNDQLTGYREMINQGFDPKTLGRPLISIGNVMGYQSPVATQSGCNKAVLQRAIVKYPSCGNSQYWSVPYLTQPITLRIEYINDATKFKSFDIMPQSIKLVLDKFTPYYAQTGAVTNNGIGYKIIVPNYPNVNTRLLTIDERKALFTELERLGFNNLFDMRREPIF